MKTASFLMVGAALILLLGLASWVSADEGDSLWSRTYGGDDDEWLYSLIQDSDGGYSMAGLSYSAPGYLEDVYMVKTDAAGDTLWTRFLGGTGADRAWEHFQTADGGYLVAGYTSEPGTTVSDMWLARLNAQGDSLWTRAWGGTGNEEARAMAPMPGGGCVLAGYTASFGAGLADFYVVRTDSSGNTLWSQTFGGNLSESASAVVPTSDGGILVAGMTNTYGAGWEDVWVVKMSGDGDSLWSHTYGGPVTDEVWSMIAVSGGGYLIAGLTASFGAGGDDVWLIRIAEDGNELWNQTFGGIGNDQGWAVTEISDGGFLITGKTNSFGAGAYDLWLLKSSADGDSLWSRTFGDTGNDNGNAVIQNEDGNYLVAGSTWLFTGVQNDVWLVCVEGPPTGVEPQTQTQPLRFSLEAPHPNPFNPTTVLSFELRVPSLVNLEVFDVNGERVMVGFIPTRQYPAGTHHIPLDGSDLPSGVYLARLTSQPSGSGATPTTAVQKLVLLK